MKLFCNKVFKNYFVFLVAMMASEIIFRLVVDIPLKDWAMVRIFLGINILALLFSALYSFASRLIGDILTGITIFLLQVYALGQAGFVNYLGVYISFGTSSQAGAVKDYIADYFASFSWQFWLILIPLIFVILFYILVEKKVSVIEANRTIDFSDKFDSLERKESNMLDEKLKAKKKRRVSRIDAIVIALVLAGLYYGTLSLKFMQNELQLKTTKALFINPDIPNIAVGQFGTSGFLVIDVKNVIIPAKAEEEKSTYDEGFVKEEREVTDYSRNIDDTAWESVIESEKNSNYKKLNNYFISQEITDKNSYTGMFKDKNLLLIMMESTTNIVLDEEYFPNMYKLYTQGWAWKNSYSPRNSCSTGNNEMSGMVSLFTVNNTCTANIYKDNVYPEAIFNLFNNQGYTTTSYHNYTEHYYYRKVIHPNMGSGHYYGVQELGIPYSNVYHEWPSDVELIDKVLDITKEQDKFMAWVTTVSAHQPYTQDSELSKKNYEYFADTDYNQSMKRYLSKLKEFDLAIGELIDGLEKQGKLDDTVIVLFADHYPYGLNNTTLNSYYDYDVGVNNEVDRTPFVIYNPQLTPNLFEEYTSYMNIVPTLANLFDLDYDPRLYVGKDILSDNYENRVIFADGSWQDNKAFYNAATGKISYVNNGDSYTPQEIKDINTQIKDRISMSNLAVKTNYFEDLFKKIEKVKEEVTKEIEPDATEMAKGSGVEEKNEEPETTE